MDLAIGQRIRFRPHASNRWWTIRALDDRYVVATQVAPFTSNDLQYTIVDLTGWDHTYNGVGPGVVRSSLNTLGGGYDVGPDGKNCQQLLDDLVAGTHQFSPRRVMAVNAIEVERRPAPVPANT